MADNVTIPAQGTGDSTPVVATDDVSAVHFQKVKIADGTADSSAMVPGSATDGLLVNLGTNNDVTVTSISAGDNNIGNVDVVSSALPTGAATESTLSTLDGKVTACNTGAVVISSGTVTADLGANNDVTVQGEDAENAPATAAPVQVGGRYDATPRTLGDTDVGAIALDADGAVHVSDGGNTLTVDGSVTVSGTVTADAGTNLNTSALALETGGNLATIAGDTTSLDGKITACNTGAVTISAELPAGTQNIGDVDIASIAAGDNNIGNVDVVTMPGTAAEAAALPSVFTVIAGDDGTDTHPIQTDTNGNVQIAGDIFADAGDSTSKPVKVGARATSSVSGETAVASTDRTNLYAGLDGVLITRPHANLEDVVSGNASNTDGNSTQCIAAGAAGIKHYLTSVTLTNTSGTDTYCEIKDGSTAMWTFPVPANGGVTHTWPTPLEGTAATAWNFDPGAAVTTMYCSMSGFKSKI